MTVVTVDAAGVITTDITGETDTVTGDGSWEETKEEDDVPDSTGAEQVTNSDDLSGEMPQC